MSFAGSVSFTLAESGSMPGIAVAFIIGFIVLSFIGSSFLAKSLRRKFDNSGVLTNGVAARAQITSLEQTRTRVNDEPFVRFGLRVHRDGMAPYDAQTKQVLPFIMLGTVTPGKWVHVKMPPDNPQKIAIDFNAPIGDHEAG